MTRMRASLLLVSLVVACGRSAVTPPRLAQAAGAPAEAPPAPTPPPPAHAEGTPAAVGGLASAPLFTASTHALIVGLLQFGDPAMTSFATADRRDVEIARALVARGVPAAQVTTILDAAATRAAVLESLARVADATPSGGTLIVYYAGHGTRTSDGDVAYIAYDTTSAGVDADGLSVSALYATLAPRVAGKRVLFLADCCHSGGLGGLAARLSGNGAVAGSITSADASNLSTGNWTYSQVILEALRGDACLDADGDGAIAITELEAGVRDSMRYRESQRSGSFLARFDPSLVVARRTGEARHGASAGRFMTGADEEVVEVLSDDGRTAQVRAYDYAGYRDSAVPLASLAPIAATRYPVGAELSVTWEGREWPARVTAVDGDFARITYPGWPSYWDEWILADRVRQVIRIP